MHLKLKRQKSSLKRLVIKYRTFSSSKPTMYPHILNHLNTVGKQVINGKLIGNILHIGDTSNLQEFNTMFKFLQHKYRGTVPLKSDVVPIQDATTIMKLFPNAEQTLKLQIKDHIKIPLGKPSIYPNPSGIYTIPPKELNLFNNKDPIYMKGLAYQIFEYAFILYNNNNKAIVTVKDILYNISNLTRVTYNVDYAFPMNHEHQFYSLFATKQSLLCLNLFNHAAPVNVVKSFFEDKISFNEYKGDFIPISTILESCVFVKNIPKFKKESSKVYLVNPEYPHALFEQNHGIKDQAHYDGYCYIYDNGLVAKIIPLDVKLWANPEHRLPLFKGYLSLSPKLDELYLALRFIGDLGNHIKTLEQKHPKDPGNLILREYLDNLLLQGKAMYEKQKFNQQKQQRLIELKDQIVYQIINNPKITHTVPTMITTAETYTPFEDYVKNNPESTKITIEKITEKINPKIIYPLYHEYKRNDFELLMLEIIKDLPLDIKENIYKNYFLYKKILIFLENA
jgi:hypothetical protein